MPTPILRPSNATTRLITLHDIHLPPRRQASGPPQNGDMAGPPRPNPHSSRSSDGRNWVCLAQPAAGWNAGIMGCWDSGAPWPPRIGFVSRSGVSRRCRTIGPAGKLALFVQEVSGLANCPELGSFCTIGPPIGFVWHDCPSQGPRLPAGRAELGLFGAIVPACRVGLTPPIPPGGRKLALFRTTGPRLPLTSNIAHHTSTISKS